MLGLRRGTVALVPHETAWKEEAQQMKARLRQVLGDVAVEHVGSTAIAGIPAKPILDIAVGVPDFASVTERLPAMEAAGFLLRPSTHGVEEMLFVCGDDALQIRTHHIHVIRADSQTFEDYVNFREYMNAHPEKAQAYASLKQTLYTRFSDDRGAYTAGKHEFITQMLQEARVWRKESRECALRAAEK